MVEEPHMQPTDLPPALTKQEPHPEWTEWFKEHCVPICGVLLMLLVFSLVSHFRSGTGWSKARDIADTLAKVVQIFAIILARGWGYFKFVKGRTYQQSLIPIVSGKLLTIDGQTYLIVTISVKNVGQSVVEFAPDASALRVFGYTGSTSSEIMAVKDNELAQFVPLNELSIEPNETIENMRLMSIPIEARLGLRLELEIINKHKKKYSWTTSFIVEKSPSSAIIHSGNEPQQKETL